jgi:hypothetical protein
MSAFIVSDTHINALVRYASRHKLSVFFNKQLGFPFGKQQFKIYDNEQATAELLLAENVKSVNYRYRDNEVMSITYDRGAPVLTAIQAIKAAQCLRYQSCECDDFEDSIASKLIEAIIDDAIPRLEGYDCAQWAIADKEVTA